MSKSEIEYRLAEVSDLGSLIRVGDDLFDYPIKEDMAKEFLVDPRHLLMIALDSDDIVGMASGFIHVHPDKDSALFIDEVGVITAHQKQGIGKKLMSNIVEKAFYEFDCKDAWVLTDDSNIAAKKTYISAGGRQSDQPTIMFEFQRKSSSK